MRSNPQLLIVFLVASLPCARGLPQQIQFPSSGQRPIAQGTLPSTSTPAMVPLNPATQQGIYPSTGYGSPLFDPYATGVSPTPVLPPGGSQFGVGPTTLAPPGSYGSAGGYPGYNGAPPLLPGAGSSATVGTFPNSGPAFNQPGVYPNSSPSALFPGNAYGGNAYGSPQSGSLFGNMYNSIFGSANNGYGGSYGQLPGGGQYQAPPGPNIYGNPPAWNPQGSVFQGQAGYPEFIRFFQGPRFRHAYIYGNNDADALAINDSDLALAFAWPNFLFSTQPLYLMPSFSLHQWDGPKPDSTADLPALAYSAFLDSGWQSDPARIMGAEFGLRVGMFSDFDTATSDSLRIMGRGIGRVRLTPKATLKGGVMYLDRNKVKLLPAFGLLWQPNPDTRFDLFFPEPKLAHYLSTIGTQDTWWYVGGYYGGGAWTVKRTSGIKESIDINDLRLVLGMEWGRNDQMREGRRSGFFEVGYVFDRELLYHDSTADNLSLQDTIMFRAGLGF